MIIDNEVLRYSRAISTRVLKLIPKAGNVKSRRSAGRGGLLSPRSALSGFRQMGLSHSVWATPVSESTSWEFGKLAPCQIPNSHSRVKIPKHRGIQVSRPEASGKTFAAPAASFPVTPPIYYRIYMRGLSRNQLPRVRY